MIEPTPTAPPVALTIAGSDSGGGAGIQADLSTFTAHDVFGASAITAVTAQHTRGVESSHVLSREAVAAQFDAVADDFAVGAAKTGMLATADIVELVAERASSVAFPLVVDPVMVATSGDRLLDRDAEAAYEALIAEATVVTPNADEATVLTDVEIADVADAVAAGRELLTLGVDAALVKGGHVPGETVTDVLVADPNAVDPDAGASGVDISRDDGAIVATFEHERVDTDATHGSGCTFSAAIAARLARGEDLLEAVGDATDFVARAIEAHYDVGRGPGAVNPQADRRSIE
ncbi:bifunctional hydroxymethylpyrimidine kinase/phosphomethylpyrimidine kinase [Halovivax limisalsi]|uniref:bifunctional hydroxymethylpyrimidine kinase/phosphomethylpyrimidine kinase n=1 Tax=Halovivax limisalsi TaxID=1453760 RepID=UPI001FFC7240|nr:bifunctional hydroxymethylpyrimidine kinase/phosphomethylpyrimidine kinase [Halovivax limisalsi]